MEKMGYAVSPIGEPTKEEAAQHLSSGQKREPLRAGTAEPLNISGRACSPPGFCHQEARSALPSCNYPFHIRKRCQCFSWQHLEEPSFSFSAIHSTVDEHIGQVPS
jgi:hypothetical protein